MYVPVSIGGPSGSPVRAISPDIACAIGSNSARADRGPVCPNPDSEVTIRPGLSSCRCPEPRPIDSSVPGR